MNKTDKKNIEMLNEVLEHIDDICYETYSLLHDAEKALNKINVEKDEIFEYAIFDICCLLERAYDRLRKYTEEEK